MGFANNEEDKFSEAIDDLDEVESQVRHYNNVGLSPSMQILSHF